MTQVRLIEVVDVEDEDAGGVDVGAVVLGVQVAVDPDAAGALVRVAVLGFRHVRVEQAGAPPIERKRVLRHLAELAPKGARIRLDQVREGVDQDLDDLLRAGHTQAARSRVAHTSPDPTTATPRLPPARPPRRSSATSDFWWSAAMSSLS